MYKSHCNLSILYNWLSCYTGLNFKWWRDKEQEEQEGTLGWRTKSRERKIGSYKKGVKTEITRRDKIII